MIGISALLRTRPTAIWVLLMVATCFSWEAVHGARLMGHAHAGAVLVIVIAFLKARFIMLDFMELRTAPVFVRMAAEAWILAVGGGLIGLFLWSAG